MKTTKQTQREAKRLFRLCVVSGALDETRVRQVVQRVIAAGRPGSLGVLSRFHRLVRLESDKHRAEVSSAAPLSVDMRTGIEAGLTRLYGQGIATSFADDASLIGGVRIKVGSDVLDGSVKARLAALASGF